MTRTKIQTSSLAFNTGSVLVGSGSSTGTASQPLQVTGGAYISGSIGVGTTNPSSALHVAGDINTASINSGPLAGFRNAIINGNFNVWQRGTSFSTSSNPYYADRWTSNGNAKEVDRRTFTLGQTEVPGNPTYYLEFALTDTSSSGPNLNQPIEYVSTFAGQKVTLSFWARAVGSGFALPVDYQQNFGTGGSPSSSVSANFGTPTLTTSWAQYTYTLTLPSISGKTLGSDNNDHLKIRFKPPANTVCEFQIASVQLEAGPVATPFERRPIGTELALCQRYYEVGSVAFCWNAGTPSDIKVRTNFSTTKRGTPTSTYTAALGTAVSSTASSESIQINFSGTTNGNVAANWTASAEL